LSCLEKAFARAAELTSDSFLISYAYCICTIETSATLQCSKVIARQLA